MQTVVAALLSVGLLKYDRDPSAVARLLEGMGLGWISQDSISCALSTLTSQFGEDRLLLPTLLQAARGGGDGPRAGTFVELGALDGTTWSNTLVLERCFGWRGLLIEANPMNFYKLNQSTRTSHKVHSAVCTCAEAQTEAHQGCTTVVSARSGPFSGNPNSSTVQKYWSQVLESLYRASHCRRSSEMLTWCRRSPSFRWTSRAPRTRCYRPWTRRYFKWSSWSSTGMIQIRTPR